MGGLVVVARWTVVHPGGQVICFGVGCVCGVYIGWSICIVVVGGGGNIIGEKR